MGVTLFVLRTRMMKGEKKKKKKKVKLHHLETSSVQPGSLSEIFSLVCIKLVSQKRFFTLHLTPL